MKKIICIADSFKGTMSSRLVNDLMEERVKYHFPECEVRKINVADGGEGTVDAFLSALNGEKIWVEVNNPYFESVQSFYGIIPGNIAVIEMATAAGLPMVEDRKNPELTTTYGVGELIKDAIDRGCKKIIMGLGGSCTNDGGCGAAAALGIKFFDEDGTEFVPTGLTLSKIKKIDYSQINQKINHVEFVTMCDIDNPMHGLFGAAYVFSPQKGADPAMVERLDVGLKNLGNVLQNVYQKDFSEIAGAGAAGAMGAGMLAFFNSKLQMGIETMLDLVKFEEELKDCDLVLTGEGKIDSQSLRGKVPVGVAQSARKQGVPVVAVVGTIGQDIDSIYETGLTAIFSLIQEPMDYNTLKTHSEEFLSATVDNIMRLIKSTTK